MSNGQVRVAVIGTGDIGRGWAALIAAAGWPVALYDHHGQNSDDALAEIADRARRLVELHRADSATVERGIKLITVGRSLLEACRDAQWIIEAIHEDVKAKQKLVESLEAAAPEARVVSSSSTAVTAKQLVARATRPERCMIVHPLNPPELIPLVEVVPGPQTDRMLVELVRGWLRAIGRVPILVKKPILGNVVGRITAAVWREAIDLVLQGVIDVDDLDRAVSLGPALGWAAAGPYLTYHLGAGDEGFGQFLQHLNKTFESVWSDLATWSRLDPEQRHTLIHTVERTYEGKLTTIREARDRRLAAILKGLEDARSEK
ncbi:MAG: 3-hydroxyacyl-CoA dehydrogenase NAD-binding domain-containing protein [Gemmatimonadales bacterium]